MTSRFKTNRKKHVHVRAGHARIGKHRKHLRVRGNAGGMHHHRILFDKASKDNAPLIDVTQFGYFKVLEKGLLPEGKSVLLARLVSKNAGKKIKEASGTVVLTACLGLFPQFNFAFQFLCNH
ncbi:60S ribosomal protein L27a-3-like [Salvia divinorum]|uniref:60S ribosomal protein L27a-3-like n=1 Tax=Salvia divinorum TaxID=28513 RepID=A0ABD1IM44_SALDI